MHIIKTFWIAKDGNGSQFEYSEKPTWYNGRDDQYYRGKYLRPNDFGLDINTGNLLSAGDCVQVTLSMTFAEPVENCKEHFVPNPDRLELDLV